MKSQVVCLNCNINFLLENYKINEKGNYCSRKCSCQHANKKRWENHDKTKNPSGKHKKCKKCNISIDRRNKNGLCLKCFRESGLNKMSEEVKQIISQKRKQYLKDNPDKHPWKIKNKFKSKPCENFKTILKENNYEFLEEFTPNFDKNYSIDIAFPEKMIGIEINGNQHYERDGTLKKYYQDRHDYIEGLGWKLYQIHYSLCFDVNYVLDLVAKIVLSPNKIEFNHEEYVIKKMERKSCYNKCSCGSQKWKDAKFCLICSRKNRKVYKKRVTTLEKPVGIPGQRKTFTKDYHTRKHLRKIERPTKEVLHYLIWNNPTTKLSKLFSVSDVAIAKWCKIYKIKKPERGYWAKYAVKQIIDYQI